MKAFAALTLLLVSACAAQQSQPLATPSGNPEVTIQGAARKQVVDRIVADAASRGLAVRSASDYGVVIDQTDIPFSARVAFGSRAGNPAFRQTYTIAEVPDGVKVFLQTRVISNAGTGFEQPTDISPYSNADMQSALDLLRNTFR